MVHYPLPFRRNAVHYPISNHPNNLISFSTLAPAASLSLRSKSKRTSKSCERRAAERICTYSTPFFTSLSPMYCTTVLPNTSGKSASTLRSNRGCSNSEPWIKSANSSPIARALCISLSTTYRRSNRWCVVNGVPYGIALSLYRLFSFIPYFCAISHAVSSPRK